MEPFAWERSDMAESSPFPLSSQPPPKSECTTQNPGESEPTGNFVKPTFHQSKILVKVELSVAPLNRLDAGMDELDVLSRFW